MVKIGFLMFILGSIYGILKAHKQYKEKAIMEELKVIKKK